jgi:sulfur-carrier protein
MQINFYATLRPIVGGRSIELDLPGDPTVREMIDAVIARHPDLAPHLIDPDGQLYRHVHVFVNGRDAPYLDNGLATRLTPADTIDIFPPVAGG